MGGNVGRRPVGDDRMHAHQHGEDVRIEEGMRHGGSGPVPAEPGSVQGDPQDLFDPGIRKAVEHPLGRLNGVRRSVGLSRMDGDLDFAVIGNPDGLQRPEYAILIDRLDPLHLRQHSSGMARLQGAAAGVRG